MKYTYRVLSVRNISCITMKEQNRFDATSSWNKPSV